MLAAQTDKHGNVSILNVIQVDLLFMGYFNASIPEQMTLLVGSPSNSDSGIQLPSF